MNIGALLALGLAGYLVFNYIQSSAAPESPSGGSKVNPLYPAPILSGSVSGITFSVSYNVPPGTPVNQWVLGYATNLTFSQGYAEASEIPPNVTEKHNDQANALYFFRVKFVDHDGISSPWSNTVGPLISGAQPATAPIVGAPVGATSTASNGQATGGVSGETPFDLEIITNGYTPRIPLPVPADTGGSVPVEFEGTPLTVQEIFDAYNYYAKLALQFPAQYPGFQGAVISSFTVKGDGMADGDVHIEHENGTVMNTDKFNFFASVSAFISEIGDVSGDWSHAMGTEHR